MIAPYPVYTNAPPSLLGHVRQALSLRPGLADYPRQLAKHLEANEQAVQTCLEALHVEGSLCL